MKKLKGFTLIECIVAMALIGLTSLLMVQVYGTVARMNSDNNGMNNSIERQMQYAEKQLTKEVSADDGVVKVRRLSSHKSGSDVSGHVGKIEIYMNNDDSGAPMNSKLDVGKNKSSAVKVDVDLYVIGVEVSAAATEEYGRGAGAENYDDNNIRYKFVMPKPHSK